MSNLRRYKYVGEPMLTRGDYGERVDYGYARQESGHPWDAPSIYIQDADFGLIWICPEEKAHSFGFVLDEKAA